MESLSCCYGNPESKREMCETDQRERTTPEVRGSHLQNKITKQIAADQKVIVYVYLCSLTSSLVYLCLYFCILTQIVYIEMSFIFTIKTPYFFF